MSTLPTVKIIANNPRGWCIINASEFDPDIHQRFDGAGGKAEQALKTASVAKAKSQAKGSK